MFARLHQKLNPEHIMVDVWDIENSGRHVPVCLTCLGEMMSDHHQDITFTPLALEAHDLAVENQLLNQLQRRGVIDSAEQTRALLDSFTGNMHGDDPTAAF